MTISCYYKWVANVRQVYPNPNNGVFTINIVETPCMASLQVYNMLGEKVYDVTLKQVQGDNRIDLSNQSNGVYFYRVITQNGVLIGQGKLIIAK